MDGILNHYVQFKREASKRLRAQPHPARVYSLDFSLLDRRWALTTLAVTALIAGIAIILKIVDPDGHFMKAISPSDVECILYVTDVVFQFWKWLVFIGPLFALMHLLQNRWAIRRLLGNRVQLGMEWPIWLALLVVLVLTLGELWNLFS